MTVIVRKSYKDMCHEAGLNIRRLTEKNQKLLDFVKDIAKNGYSYGGLICQEEAEGLLKALEDE